MTHYQSAIQTPRPAVVGWLEPHHRSVWTEMLLGYGAVILSFVGALPWGFAMVHPVTRTMNGMYAWSVLRSLLGQGMPQETLSA